VEGMEYVKLIINVNVILVIQKLMMVHVKYVLIISIGVLIHNLVKQRCVVLQCIKHGLLKIVKNFVVFVVVDLADYFQRVIL
jgi:hypothetical protein